MLTINVGGSADSDDTDVNGQSPDIVAASAVITLTAAVK